MTAPITTADELRQSEAPAVPDDHAPTFAAFASDALGGPPESGQHHTVVIVNATFVPETTFRIESEGLVILEPECPRTHDDDIRAQVSALWAEDWDSEDDAVYDDW